ncbi:MAG TPA: hypothetical protein VGG41_16665 [Solirubrobacteraceae bacterium]|jgi:hypothetical protein
MVASTAIGAGHVFTVGPSFGLIGFTVLGLVLLACAVVTATKGRWGWLALGLLTAGLLWILGAIKPALPGSLWERLRSGRTHRPAN